MTTPSCLGCGQSVFSKDSHDCPNKFQALPDQDDYSLVEKHLNDARISWSANCCSGLLGDACRCWRCRKEAGDSEANPNDKTEEWWAKIYARIPTPSATIQMPERESNEIDESLRRCRERVLLLVKELERSDNEFYKLFDACEEEKVKVCRVVSVLHELEWVADPENERLVCPYCHGTKYPEGHVRSCKLAALLSETSDLHCPHNKNAEILQSALQEELNRIKKHSIHQFAAPIVSEDGTLVFPEPSSCPLCDAVENMEKTFEDLEPRRNIRIKEQA